MRIISGSIKILTACKFLSYTRGSFLSEIPFIHAGPLPTLASHPIVLMHPRVGISMRSYTYLHVAFSYFLRASVRTARGWQNVSVLRVPYRKRYTLKRKQAVCFLK